MASIDQVVQLIFKGVDNASGTINGIAKPLAGIANAMLVAETAALGLGAALIATGVNTAGEFQKNFQFITTLFDEGSLSVGKFRQDILDYAAGSTQSLESINKALETAIGSGIDYADSLKLIKEAEKLAVAQGGELADTTGLLVSTLNAYGLSADKAATLSDQFSVTIRDGKISVGELSSQLANISPIAAAAGVGFDQIGAATAVLTANGYKAGPAITGIRGIIEGLVKPTGEAADYAESLGIAFNATALKSDGLQGVLKKVYEATGGNVESMAKLFTTTEGLAAALSLGGIGAKDFEKELQAMKEAAGVTGVAFDKMAGSLEGASTKIKNALDVAFVNLGTPLLDEVTGIAGGIAGAFTELGKAFQDGGPLRPLTAALESWGKDLGGIVAKIVENLPAALGKIDISGLLDSLSAGGAELRSVFSAFFGEIDLTTVDGLASALQTVINTFKTLTQITTGIVAEFKPFAAAIGATVREFNNLDDASKADFGSFLGQMKAIADAGLLVGASLIAIGRTGADVGDVLGRAFGAVGVVVNALQVSFDGTVIALTKIWQTALEASLGLYKLNPFADDKIITDVEKRIQAADELISAVSGNLARNSEEMNAAWSKMTDGASAETEGLTKKLNQTERGLIDLRQTMDRSKQGAQGLQASFKELGQIKVEPLVELEVLDRAKQKTIEWGDAIRGLPKPELPQGVQKAEGVYQAAGKAAGDYAVSVQGVSTVYSQMGKETVKATGAFKGVIDKTEDAKKSLEGLAQSGKLSVDQMIEVTKTANDFKEKMESIASNERLKNMEFAVQLKTSQLETDAERVKATFGSIDTSIASTGDLLGSLFGSLADADRWTQLNIEKQIAIENQRRQEALDIQKKLAEAEIERVQAQIASLNRGDALIKIEGGSLAPELEAFMWKILGLIRVRANAEFADYLLGVGA